MLQKLFLGYLKLLEKTVTIRWEEDCLWGNGQIFGFWHEDSFLMNLVLKELSKKTAPVDVIVTADTRGDYIAAMIEQYGGNALRVPDGTAAYGTLKKMIQKSYEQTRSLAVSLDGPLGPRHEPKKLAFWFSEQSGEDFVGITAAYSSCLRMFWRWDRYAVPLPFSTVTVAVKDYGEVDKRHIPELPVRAYPDVRMPEYQSGLLLERREECIPKGRAAGRLIRDALRYQ